MQYPSNPLFVADSSLDCLLIMDSHLFLLCKNKCWGEDSNLHRLPHRILSPARLPVPPPQRQTVIRSFKPNRPFKESFFTVAAPIKGSCSKQRIQFSLTA